MPKSSSSPLPTIIPMNMNPNPNPNPDLPCLIKPHHAETETLSLTHAPPPTATAESSVAVADDFLRSFSMDDDEEEDPNSSHHHAFSSLLDEDTTETLTLDDERKPFASASPCFSFPFVDPAPHISSQFYTFNRDSHSLMIRCILESRLASPEEIKAATPRSVLSSWRTVWKDRNEDTAYLTAWKRIQDKLNASSEPGPSLYFKSNPAQRVSHVDQWLEIVSGAHADPDLLRHLSLKDTIDRIKQNWTVGAKFYGIPESFVRVCISSCPVCSSVPSSSSISSSSNLSSSFSTAAAAARSKRRRFEYTETLDVPARDVPRRLQQLAAKHKVVLCIRQKYIRYKPFMAEVKDYACHRAGEPTAAASSSGGAATSAAGGKKARVVKREPYQSKRCGCGFRIRAIVPIANYNEKDKTFVYQEEGTAVFKLYAVHSGHEPGPLDGSARIVHRLVGHKAGGLGLGFDPEIYGLDEDGDNNNNGSDNNNSGLGFATDDSRQLALHQLQELRTEILNVEGRIVKLPTETMGPVVSELSEIIHRIRQLGSGSYSNTNPGEEEGGMLIGPWDGVADGGAHGSGRTQDDEFDDVADRWMMKEDFEEDKPLTELAEESIGPGPHLTDPNNLFYHGTKWYDSPEFRHDGIV